MVTVTQDKMPLGEALLRLDPNNDEHWTADGAPVLDVVADLVGRGVSRGEIAQAAPGLNRVRATEASILGEPVHLGDYTKDARAELQADHEGRNAMQATLDQRRRELAAFDAETAGRAQKRKVLEARVAAAYNAMVSEYPPLKFAENVQAHLLAEHTRKQQNPTPARIDMAFARRNTRGWRRPVMVNGAVANTRDA